MQVIAHWSSPAPELKLLPAKVIPVVERVCMSGCISLDDHNIILTHSAGLVRLIQYDEVVQQRKGNGLGQSLGAEHASRPVSAELLALLKVMLQKARAGLTGKSRVTTVPWSTSLQPMEDMLRTGTYAPHHPVFRSLPFFKYDYLNKQQVERYALNKEEELRNMRAERTALSQRMGSTCNKLKTKQKVLSSGVFTILCNRCGIIEYFELMCQPESPATPARALFHRIWRPADTLAQYL